MALLQKSESGEQTSEISQTKQGMFALAPENTPKPNVSHLSHTFATKPKFM
jgi:hypothetical protein